jgi:hypothetical protein
MLERLGYCYQFYFECLNKIWQFFYLFNSNSPYCIFEGGISDLEFLEFGTYTKKNERHWAVDHLEYFIRWLLDVPKGNSAHYYILSIIYVCHRVIIQHTIGKFVQNLL